MKAAVLYGPRRLSVEEVSTPDLDPGEVLIKVEAAGICGTDVQIYDGSISAHFPVIPGHEFAGVIASSQGKGLAVGTRVFAQGSWGCGICEWCKSGMQARCSQRKMLGKSVDGAFAQYVKVPASVVYPLAQGVEPEDAQSLVTLACGVHAVRRASARFGSGAVVVGSGHAALLLLQVMRIAGYDRIAVVGGSRETRLELARRLGADLAVSSRSADFKTELARLFPKGADVVFETSGSVKGLELSLDIVKVGGTVVVFSIYPDRAEQFPVSVFYDKEVTVIGSKGAGGAYLEAMRLLEQRRVSVKPLVTHVLPLDRVNEGFELMSSRSADAIRIVIVPWQGNNQA
ncbi:MAG: zinc-dependent alcohol dehydrogenase [Bacillota bacterium]